MAQVSSVLQPLRGSIDEETKMDMSRLIGKQGPGNVSVLEGPSRELRLSVSSQPTLDNPDDSTDFGPPPAFVEVVDTPVRRRETPQNAAQGWLSVATPEAESGSSAHDFDTLGPLPSDATAAGQSGFGGGQSGFAGGAGDGGNSSFHAANRSLNFSSHGSAEVRQWSARNTQDWNARQFQISGKALGSSDKYVMPLAAENDGNVFPPEVTLAERRTYEEEIIQRFDRLSINTGFSEFWFIIDAIWMNQWINFIVRKGKPPGPISNENLFDREWDDVSDTRRESILVAQASRARSVTGVMANRPDLRLKAGLKKIRDFRAIHPLVWYIFREMYDTDDTPEICRWKPDIYSAEVTPQRKIRLEKETHTKAVYELRRYVAKIKENVARRAEEAQAGSETESRLSHHRSRRGGGR